jgi:hypothetical protein
MPIVREMMQQAGSDMAPPGTVDMYELHDLIHP